MVPFAQTAGMKTSRTPLRGGWDTRSRRGRGSHGEHTAGVWWPAGLGTARRPNAGARRVTERWCPQQHPAALARAPEPRAALHEGPRGAALGLRPSASPRGGCRLP